MTVTPSTPLDGAPSRDYTGLAASSPGRFFIVNSPSVFFRGCNPLVSSKECGDSISYFHAVKAKAFF